MFGLPRSTELNRQLPKKNIFAKFNMSTADRAKFDADIRKLAIVGEISPTTTNIASGETVVAIYVILVSLRTSDFDHKNLTLLSKLINQKMLFVLEHEGRARLAVVYTKLLQSVWKPLSVMTIELKGLDLDAVWDNILIQVSGVQIELGKTLEEQLLIVENREKLRRQVDRLERLARSEKQPRRKFELVQEFIKLKKELQKLDNGGNTSDEINKV